MRIRTKLFGVSEALLRVPSGSHALRRLIVAEDITHARRAHLGAYAVLAGTVPVSLSSLVFVTFYLARYNVSVLVLQFGL